MHTKLSWTLLIISYLGFSMPEAAHAESISTVPPGFEEKWDIASQGSNISRSFTAEIDHTYDFGLSFQLTSSESTLSKLRAIVGDGAIQYWPKDPNNHTPIQVGTPDEQRQALLGVKNGIYVVKHVHPGVSIPVHVKIEMLSDKDVGQTTTVLDETVDPLGADSSDERSISRNMVSVHLVPGKYTVSLTTTKETDLPPGVETYFYVGGRFFQ